MNRPAAALGAPPRASVCIKALRACVAGAAALGLPPPRALAAIGASAELLADPRARVAHEHAMHAWRALTTQLAMPAFGIHAARLIGGAAFDVVDHALAHCTTMRDVIAVLVRYQRLLHEASDIRLEPGAPGRVRLSQRFRASTPPAPAFADFVMAQWLLRAEHLVGARPTRARVELAHAAPADRVAHEQLFGEELAFDAPASALSFEASYLDRPVLRADRSLTPVLLCHATDLLAALPAPRSFAEALRQHLLARLDAGPPSIVDAARALGVSTRSLQRHLAQERASFKAVLDDARRTLAEAYLRDGTRTVSEVAFLVGFAELSAFSRAFRRWTGHSAVSYRDAARATLGAGVAKRQPAATAAR